MKNYEDSAGTASTDNTLQDLLNSSYDMKAEFNNCLYCLLKIIPSLKTKLKHAYPYRSMLSSPSIVHI